MSFKNMPIETLLKPDGYPCACGRIHSSGLHYLKIGSGAVNYLKEALDTLGRKKPFFVCDLSTKAAAWDKVKIVLEKDFIPYTFFCLDSEHPEPDEYTVGSMLMAFDPSCDVIVGIGSGVINDSCKVLAHAADIPAISIATAPSMDGYASNSSSMIQGGVKVSHYNACPQAILADTDILKNAPERMLWAGLGDMLAKYISICEWRISHLVTGEYYCENIAGLMRSSLKRIVNVAPRLMQRDSQVIEAVTEGLILSGVAMAFAGFSRPASGLEHYFSHIWEMMAMERKLPYDLHGIQVGVGTLLTFKIYDEIRKLQPKRETAEAFMRSFDSQRWEAIVQDIFGSTADIVLQLEAVLHRNDAQSHSERLDMILSHWNEIQNIIHEELPPRYEVESLMQLMGMPMTPEDLGIAPADVRKALIGSRDMRDKYLTSALLWDLGLLDQIAQRFE